jgi:hypothetical protein
LLKRVNGSLAATLGPLKLVQTSRLSGKEMDGGAPFDPDEIQPAKIAFKAPPLPGGEAAAAAAVQKIFDELQYVPPPRTGRQGVRETFSARALPPFPAKALEPFAADYMDSWLDFEGQAEKYPLRAAVIKAAKALHDNADKFKMKEVFKGNNTAQVKKEVFKEQAEPGKAIFFLKEALRELQEAGEDRKREKSKRWQAHYDYVLTRLKSRLIYLNEYNYVLAQIRSDSLPALENGFSGYRLASLEKVTINEGEVRDWFREVSKAWPRMVTQYPDTPWALIARREQLNALGLEWRPSRE